MISDLVWLRQVAWEALARTRDVVGRSGVDTAMYAGLPQSSPTPRP